MKSLDLLDVPGSSIKIPANVWYMVYTDTEAIYWHLIYWGSNAYRTHVMSNSHTDMLM